MKLFNIMSEAVRNNAVKAILDIPLDAKMCVRISKVKRNLEQNAKMWALLAEFANQAEYMGRRFSSEAWKDILTASYTSAYGKMDLVPSLENKEQFILVGASTSRMNIKEMADFITYIEAIGVSEFGIKFKEILYE